MLVFNILTIATFRNDFLAVVYSASLGIPKVLNGHGEYEEKCWNLLFAIVVCLKYVGIH